MWAALIVAIAILGGATYFFGWHWVDYCKDWYPDSQWIRVELWTAYWFAVLLLLMLVRFLFNM